MKKLFISASIAMALGLTGCGGGETIEDIQAETPVVTPFSRIVFDPAAGNLNTPNDLLMLPGDDGFFDFTLNIPVADPTDFGDPVNALNILDGWSTQQPFVIDVETPTGVSLDASTLSAGVFLYEATLGLNQEDPDCAAVTTPSAGCKIGDQLTFGEDYVLSLLDDNTISVVPLKPLKSAQGYMLVMTTGLRDSSGKSVQGSTTWDSVRQDINTFPLSSEAQLSLQGLVNSLVAPVMGTGLSREDITYVSAFTTQSIPNVLSTVKQLMVAEFAARAAAGDPTAGTALPAIVVGDNAGAPNAMEALGLVTAETVAGAVQLGVAGLPAEAAPLIPVIEATDFSALQTCDGLFGTASGALAGVWGPVNDFAVGVSQGILAEAGPFCAATRFESSITLPHYLATPRAENPLAPVNEFWSAACDSGIVLANTPAEVLATATPGPNAALCQQVGLADVRINGEMLDGARNLTKFSPVPNTTALVDIDVQITVPNPTFAAGLGFPITKPDAGWPVVILNHGITGTKEQMMAISGTLSLAGIATIAIDQPLHGSRGYDLDGDGNDDLNASTVSVTHYMNLASLPTARDNLRQSVSDLLGLRLGLNALIDATSTQVVDIDTTRVSVMGVSLGAITGVNFAALANTTMGGDLAALDGMYAITAASLESPAGGIANFLLESPEFGPVVKGQLLLASSEEFVAFVTENFGSTTLTSAQLRQAVPTFLDALSPAQLAAINAVFAEFTFASQTVIDAGDPTNYGTLLGSNTPVHMLTVVGDGGEVNLPDQVNPVMTSLPLSGQNPLAAIIGLDQVSTTVMGETPVSGQVRFTEGAHASSLSPTASPAATVEMQRQVAGYIASDARVLPITNTDVIAN